MKVKAGLSDVKLRGKIRCVLHLVNVLPLVGSLEVMFLDIPKLDFEFHGAANVLDMPGLHGMIIQVVMEVLKNQMVYPNKITIINTENVPLHKMLTPKPIGAIKLVMVEAAHLPKTDFEVFQLDPYCKIQVILVILSTFFYTICKDWLHFQNYQEILWMQSCVE